MDYISFGSPITPLYRSVNLASVVRAVLYGVVLFLALLWFKVSQHRKRQQQRRFDASFNQISSDLARPLFPAALLGGKPVEFGSCDRFSTAKDFASVSRFSFPLFFAFCLGFGLFILAAGYFLPSYFSLNKIVFIRFDRCLNLTASSCLFNMFKNKRCLPALRSPNRFPARSFPLLLVL